MGRKWVKENGEEMINVHGKDIMHVVLPCISPWQPGSPATVAKQDAPVLNVRCTCHYSMKHSPYPSLKDSQYSVRQMMCRQGII